MDICIGWDPRDDLAFRVCEASLRARASVPVNVIPLRDHALRAAKLYTRPFMKLRTGQMIDSCDGRPFSTEFAFTRFLSPLVAKGEWCLFCDADFLWRADVAELLALADDRYTVMVVKHDHQPPETSKMDGVCQGQYFRKNWSSLMLINRRKWKLSADQVNVMAGVDLHAFTWLPDSEIGELPERWNWLEGHSDPAINPAAVHFTRGTPDMIGDGIPYAAEWRAWL